ncbi:aminopeptidase P family protein [Falsirhodobacter sp. 20TX0035]|uniref:aminopeptidase P family protein n=1 Tax=Falsirhodobacter sp. 20TX0035 TaxID=3022019 RepID=UPI002330F297|nr:aminopeptidase P family protein [Falsirhodobacter sp. 20TX0035]MDB6453496.1 aminopeptidase P family protein [Falsirhodobacter sp. 20TX0035]
MFQTFTSSASPEQGPPRLAALRQQIRNEGLAGFLVPRADVHQGEYVAARDDRLAWLTGFTGSAGFCVVLADQAGVFIDGRYRTQVKAQVALDHFTPVPWPDVLPGPWIMDRTHGEIGFDPWLHTQDDISKLREAGVTLRPVANLVDRIWSDQPAPPQGLAFLHPDALAGRTSQQKREDLAKDLKGKAAIITLPDSVCWLLNIRGADVPRNPVLHAFAILHDDARVDLFTDPAKIPAEVLDHLGPQVSLHAPTAFTAALRALKGPVQLDPATAPLALRLTLEEEGTKILGLDDPCRLPKACKSGAEIAGMREAHLRDAAAVIEFLAWLDREAPKGHLTEIAVVTALEGYRRATNALHDISFDTICGAGPNGAMMHYRVTEDTDRPVGRNELLLVDSGAQYADGTTDITRTMAIGDPGNEARDAYTCVVQGLINLSRVRWPKGLAGRDLDPIARFHLWLDGRDFNHGTGHGVGAFLSVHEGPQRISRISEVPLQAGMILSNEPGYYREGAFGIRLENLIVVEPAPPGADDRDQLRFETLTFVPFDRRLILSARLAPDERDWLDAYHAQVLERVGPRLSDAAREWLVTAAAPL